MIKLPAELTIAHLQDARASILSEIENSDVIDVDDSDVVRVDTLGIQFILSFINYIAAQNKQLNWQISSPLIKESISQLGIKDIALEPYL